MNKRTENDSQQKVNPVIELTPSAIEKIKSMMAKEGKGAPVLIGRTRLNPKKPNKTSQYGTF